MREANPARQRRVFSKADGSDGEEERMDTANCHHTVSEHHNATPNHKSMQSNSAAINNSHSVNGGNVLNNEHVSHKGKMTVGAHLMANNNGTRDV